MKRHAASAVLRLAVLSVLLTAVSATAADDTPHAADGDMMWLVSPMYGWNRDKMEVHGRGGQQETITETSPECGVFAMAAHPRFVVNDFLFFTEANGADVMGNLFYANAYGTPDVPVTWNLGAGHLYHKIKPDNEDIEVQVPMVKVGPQIRARPWGLTINPYVGYAWERIDTLHGDTDNDSYLYGLTVDWRWRMMALNVKYYYQDSQELDDDFNTVHVRLTTGLTRHWGAVARFDYMEHVTTDDTSVLFGPVYVF